MLLMEVPKSILRRILPALILASIEAFVALLCLISGIGILISPGNLAPNSAEMLFPGWTVYIWASGLTVGGGLALVGIAAVEHRLERIGVLSLMTTVGVFSFALVKALPGSFVTLTTFVLFTLAMAARYWLLGRIIGIQRARLRLLMESQSGMER